MIKKLKYFSNEEIDAMKTGDINTIYETCEERHSYGSIKTALSRLAESRQREKGEPSKTLISLCRDLGIVLSTYNEILYKNKAEYRYRKSVGIDFMNFLASLPGADIADENTWLRTPELWALSGFSANTGNIVKGSRSLLEKIEENKKSWCDRWVNINMPTAILKQKKNLYMVPYRDFSAIDKITPKSSRKFVESILVYPASQGLALVPPDKNKLSFQLWKEVKNLYNVRSLGYISFKYNITIAEVISILEIESFN
ncbi:MAG: hypothetical protein IJI14_06840 [Anaerolineaceae bacterium]|nr:hypothetical protein [Anaerolineaceae bacterium]